MKTPETVSPFAEALRQARLRQGRLVEDVAQICLLSENQILGIESDNYQAFYTPFFAKQATQRYAELMGVELDLPGSPWHGLITRHPTTHVERATVAPDPTSTIGDSSGTPSPASAVMTSVTDSSNRRSEHAQSSRVQSEPPVHGVAHSPVNPSAIAEDPDHREPSVPLSRRLRPLFLGAVVGAVLGALALAVYLWTNAPDPSESAVKLESKTTLPPETQAATPADPQASAANRLATSSESDSAPSDGVHTPASSSPTTAPTTSTNAAPTAATSLADANNGNRFTTFNINSNVPDDPKYRFFFKVHGRVDLKVTDATGKVLINQNAMADGDSARVVGQPPFKVVVSDGEAIELYYMTRRIHPDINSTGQYEALLAPGAIASTAPAPQTAVAPRANDGAKNTASNPRDGIQR